jgi:hypothetical protein
MGNGHKRIENSIMEKQSVSALEYIYVDAIGDLLKCRNEYKNINTWLESEYKIGIVDGWQIFVIHTIQEIEEELLLIQYRKITNNIFPFLYVTIQPMANESIHYLETKMATLGYSKAQPLDNWEQEDELYN